MSVCWPWVTDRFPLGEIYGVVLTLDTVKGLFKEWLPKGPLEMENINIQSV